MESATEFASIDTTEGQLAIRDRFGGGWLEGNSNLLRTDDTQLEQVIGDRGNKATCGSSACEIE